ncbi:TrpB-like pyridoxal phosphate-dependent enzyme, partial [candidate division WOR-3 bacterium]|nr:TrpB-like pyridoxal phosphate-dependent enzyme [candidate division WOR-3 bacterium]
MSERRQVNLGVDDIPHQWYNIIPDLPEPLPPPKDPEEGESRLGNLPKMMIGECLKQEMSAENWIDIPDGIRELYSQAGRPRPLFRALNLEKRLDTPAKLYFKSEFFSPTGSHKVNTALAQCWYAKQQGFERVTTETGAGQWGTALSYASAVTGLKCTVFWVRSVYNWKQDRLTFMELLGAKVYASPSPMTEFGKTLYDKNPENVGSLGIAISEGLEDSFKDPKATYCLGSVLNHVLIHQSVIGLETQKQFEIFDDYPDIVISCLGGGSNFGGFALPFVGDVLKKGKKIKFIAAQSQVAPNLQGEYRFDFADYAEKTPLLKMYTLGHKIDMEPIKGDGLRYHGCSPILSLLRNKGYIDTIAYPADEKHVFETSKIFMEAEGWLPAPESAYSVCCAIEEALKCKESGEKKVIAFNVSGHGFLDIPGFRVVLGL